MVTTIRATICPRASSSCSTRPSRSCARWPYDSDSGIIIGTAPRTSRSLPKAPLPQAFRLSMQRIPNEYYPTPPEATRALLSVETFDGSIWEPACGEGAIASELSAAGHKVVATDLVDYGYGIPRIDFLKETRPRAKHIVTNPPYGSGLADAFITRSLAFAQQTGGTVAMLLNLASLAHRSRTRWWREHPPARLYAIDDIVCWPSRALRPCALAFHQAPLCLGGLDPEPSRPLGLLVAVVGGVPSSTVFSQQQQEKEIIMSRYKLYRILADEPQAFYIDLCATDEAAALKAAESIWRGHERRTRYQDVATYQPATFSIDHVATDRLEDIASETRTEHADIALRVFAHKTGSSMGRDALHDLLCDLGHYATSVGLAFPDELQRAADTWRAEEKREGEP